MTQQTAVGGSYDASIYPTYPNPSWTAPKVTKKVTETMEYDEKGNLVKRTVVTEETTDRPNYVPLWTNKQAPYSVQF